VPGEFCKKAVEATNLNVMRAQGWLWDHRDEDDSEPVRETETFSLSDNHANKSFTSSLLLLSGRNNSKKQKIKRK